MTSGMRNVSCLLRISQQIEKFSSLKKATYSRASLIVLDFYQKFSNNYSSIIVYSQVYSQYQTQIHIKQVVLLVDWRYSALFLLSMLKHSSNSTLKLSLPGMLVLEIVSRKLSRVTDFSASTGGFLLYSTVPYRKRLSGKKM